MAPDNRYEGDPDDVAPIYAIKWNIGRKGRAWQGPEARARYDLTPEKIEMIQAKLFWCERDRLMMLALLLENVGLDKVVRLGNPVVWREAIDELEKST